MPKKCQDSDPLLGGVLYASLYGTRLVCVQSGLAHIVKARLGWKDS
jgi:hypothetical protein